MLHKQTAVPTAIHSLTDQDIQSHTGVTPPLDLSTRTTLKAGGYTCWWDTREGAEKCCAEHEHAGPIEQIHGSYTCYVDKGTWDTD